MPVDAQVAVPRPAPLRAEPAASASEYLLVGALASLVSLAAFLYYFGRQEILLYGDAIAHINIARRLLDSRTPGPLQLGTVWLPLPHLLSAPFLASDWAWRTGVGGSIPSMIAYVAGALGIFRLVRQGLKSTSAAPGAAGVAAWLAAVIYAANPNLIYLQATAMTESLSLALLVWATVFFAEFAAELRRGARASPGTAWPESWARAQGSLTRCALLLAAGMLTRYDSWFAGGLFVAATAAVLAQARPSGRSWAGALVQWRKPLTRFVAITAAVPLLWLAYNSLAWDNPLEFANGFYSARAIEARTTPPGAPHHPGWHSPWVAELHFVKSAKLNLGEWSPNYSWFPVAVLGAGLVLLLARPLAPWLLLWTPLPFYALSIAYGGVPIFLPVWWPYSYYNLRYGIQLLPAIAVFAAAALYFALAGTASRRWRAGLSAAAFALLAAAYAQSWLATPVSLREAQVNSRAKAVLERNLAHRLAQLPPSATLLMYLGEHGGSLQQAGIPLRRTINEGNNEIDFPRWDWALITPAQDADFVIAGAGDPVEAAVHANPRGLTPVAVLRTPEQGTVTIYRSTRRSP